MTIYGLTEPNDGKIRYVGMSDRAERRHVDHLSSKDNPGSPRQQWIQGLLRSGSRPGLVILEEESGNSKERERFWIQKLVSEGANLFNMVGRGAPRPRKEKVYTVAIPKPLYDELEVWRMSLRAPPSKTSATIAVIRHGLAAVRSMGGSDGR